MAHLHAATPRIAHRDLKAENVLLAEPLLRDHDRPCAKITDFGVAEVADGDEAAPLRLVGTPRWIAPEVFQEHGALLPADVYSFGIMVFELLTGATPFGD